MEKKRDRSNPRKRGEKQMFWKFLAAILGSLLVMSCAAMTIQDKEKTYGESAPVITDSFASPTMRPGGTWRVYLKAFDPGGDMKYIFAVVSQPGRGEYPISLTRIRAENAKELDGYLYLNTLTPSGYEFLNFANLTLTVQIKDKAGHFSKPVDFPLYFDPRVSVQESPPPGVFKDQSLGPIMVTLRPFNTDGQSGDGFF
jgi:hypothetical protein